MQRFRKAKLIFLIIYESWLQQVIPSLQQMSPHLQILSDHLFLSGSPVLRYHSWCFLQPPMSLSPINMFTTCSFRGNNNDYFLHFFPSPQWFLKCMYSFSQILIHVQIICTFIHYFKYFSCYFFTAVMKDVWYIL